MRRVAKVDSNHTEIVNGLRKYGASVLQTHQLKNCFDIIVGYKGVNIIMEIKDGNKPQSQRKLSEGEQKFKDTWKGGEYHVVLCLDDAINVLKKY